VFTYISDRPALSAWTQGLIGKRRPDAAFDHDAEVEKWRDHMATLDRHEPFRKFEYRGRDGAGRLRYFQCHGQPVFAADGRFVGYRGSSTDLTRSTRRRSGFANPRRWSDRPAHWRRRH